MYNGRVYILVLTYTWLFHQSISSRFLNGLLLDLRSFLKEFVDIGIRSLLKQPAHTHHWCNSFLLWKTPHTYVTRVFMFCLISSDITGPAKSTNKFENIRLKNLIKFVSHLTNLMVARKSQAVLNSYRETFFPKHSMRHWPVVIFSLFVTKEVGRS